MSPANVEVLSFATQWKKLVAKRDPEAPPFFVMEGDSGDCRIFGTFRDGSINAQAVPRNVNDQRWLGPLDREKAIEAAAQLNELHNQGLIDWFESGPGKSPVILTPQERDQIVQRAELLIRASEIRFRRR